MSISASLLPEFDEEMKNTRKMLERVPDGDFGWKPHEKSMSLGRLANHVAELPNWGVMTIDRSVLDLTPEDGNGPQPSNAQTATDLVAAFDRHVKEGRAAIEGASDAHLMETWSLKYKGHIVLSMPRATVLRMVVMNHLVHHRGQLSVYLRLKDVAIPGMYGPSADEGMPF